MAEPDPVYAELACKAWTASHEAHHPGCQIMAWADLAEADQADWTAAALAILEWDARD